MEPYNTPHKLSLTSDVWQYILAITKRRLRDIINLSLVSKNLHRIALLEENWYAISDTNKVLYNFIKHVLHSASKISYPIIKIRRMERLYNDNILDCPELLRIFPMKRNDFIQFYACFRDYQYLYMDKAVDLTPSDVDTIFHNRSLKGIFFLHCYYLSSIFALNLHTDIIRIYAMTEIFAPNVIINCKSLVTYCPQIEQLKAMEIYNTAYLKQTKLKYLQVARMTDSNGLIQYLPDTIETIIIIDRMHTPSSFFDFLIKFRHLNYLKMQLLFPKLSTTLCINTVHFILRDRPSYTIDIPNIKHIIIDNSSLIYPNLKLHLASLNAITCQLKNNNVRDLRLDLPNCQENKN
jgi:hypothetical protein